MGWLEIVSLRELFDFLLSKRTEEFLRKLAQKGVTQAVDALEMFEEQNQPLEMRCLELAVDAVKRMCDRVRDLCALQIALERENIVPDNDDILVLLFGDAPDQKVNLAGILRKISRDLLANKRVRQIADLQTTVDCVVVSNGDETHSALDKLSMELARVGIGIWKIKPSEKPFFRARTKT